MRCTKLDGLIRKGKLSAMLWYNSQIYEFAKNDNKNKIGKKTISPLQKNFPVI